MTKVEVVIYWNREVLVSNSLDEKIEYYQLPNIISSCLNICQLGTQKAINKINETIDDKTWYRHWGKIDLVIVVDDVEFCRMESPKPFCLKFADKEMESLSIAILKSLDHLFNKNKNDDIETITYEGGNKKFDKGNAFEGRFR